MPGETAAQKTFRAAVIDELAGRLKGLLNEGGDVTLRLDLDRKSPDLSLSLGLAPKPGSPLAADIAALAQTKSVAAGLIGGDAAVDGLVHVRLPEKLRQPLQPAVDDLAKTILGMAKNEGERQAMACERDALLNASPQVEGSSPADEDVGQQRHVTRALGEDQRRLQVLEPCVGGLGDHLCASQL